MSETHRTPSPGSASSSPPSPDGRGARKKRKPPRWTVAFLRALELCGVARRAAEAAAVDFTTAYARRRAHPDFAEAWAAAKATYAERKRREEEGNPQPTPSVSPTGSASSEEHIVGGKLKRVGEGRWSKAKERILLAELHASGNYARAAKAIGMSEQAIGRRRRKDPRLEQACEVAVAAAAKRLGWMVVAAGNQAFDPDDLPDPSESPLPPVTVREAIDILKLKGVRPGAAAEPVVEAYDVGDVANRLETKLRMLGLLDDGLTPTAAGGPAA